MRSFITRRVVLLCLLLAIAGQGFAEDKAKLRYFLFIGQPNAAAWKMMIENPQDRQAAVAKSIEKLGGQMLSYYWGLGDGRNYITIAMPDDTELIQATYVTRLGDDLLVNYEAIELMTSADMANALKRVSEIKAVDDK